ncbi:signal peptidase II [Cellulomonas cellasea]|uniref:signal peptidase II n=1 Tax=Cellulomonas cellasea TaxID=43670 RepID=UPI0025A445F4|nr:signal peptidase II [Cellulomonas cellasea]MDM8085843.1 signal peptidase II [Cellulomonas cellasea]
MPTTFETTPASAPSGAGRRRRLLLLLVLLTVGVLVLDQGTKAWVLVTLVEGERVPVLGDLLSLRLLFNPGAALSIAEGMTWILTIIATAVVVYVVRASRRIGSTTWAIALGLLLGGAIGNLGDRIFRAPGFARGHVVDFIAYGDLFVGNVADIAIVVAAGLIMLLAFRGIQIDGTRAHEPQAEGAEPPPGGQQASEGADAPDAGPGAQGPAVRTPQEGRDDG